MFAHSETSRAARREFPGPQQIRGDCSLGGRCQGNDGNFDIPDFQTGYHYSADDAARLRSHIQRRIILSTGTARLIAAIYTTSLH